MSKGNKLKAPYKDRPSKNILQIRDEKPHHYKNPKESLFYKERMVKKKTTVRLGGKERKQGVKTDEEKKKRIVKWIGKSLKEAKEDWLRSKPSSERCQMEAIPPTPWFQSTQRDKKISEIHRIVN